MVFSSFIRWAVLTNTLPEFSFTILKFSFTILKFSFTILKFSFALLAQISCGGGASSGVFSLATEFWLTASWPGSEDVSVVPPVLAASYFILMI